MHPAAKGVRVAVHDVSAAGVRILSQQSSVKRIFSFAQIFFFALTFLGSWETMAMYAPPDSPFFPRH